MTMALAVCVCVSSETTNADRIHLRRTLLCHAGGYDRLQCDTCLSQCGICDPSCSVPTPAPTPQCRPLNDDGLLSKQVFEAMEVGSVRVLRPSRARFGVGCATGGDFSFVVRRGLSTSRVVVEFQGGGACWDFESCSETNFVAVDPTVLSLDCTDWSAGTSAAFGGGLIDSTDLSNPVKDWTYVFIPYCTKVGAISALLR